MLFPSTIPTESVQEESQDTKWLFSPSVTCSFLADYNMCQQNLQKPMPPKPSFDAYYFEVILKKAASIERAGKAGSMVNRPKVSTEKENNNKMWGNKTVKEIHLY